VAEREQYAFVSSLGEAWVYEGKHVWFNGRAARQPFCVTPDDFRAAADVQERWERDHQPKRLERPTTELRGWGVMSPRGDFYPEIWPDLATAEMWIRGKLLNGWGLYRAVPVRLVLDDTQSAADAQEGNNG
jgi:hypothetical protein